MFMLCRMLRETGVADIVENASLRFRLRFVILLCRFAVVAVDLQLFRNNVNFGVKMVYEDLLSYLNGL